jgi:hypothetical protein
LPFKLGPGPNALLPFSSYLLVLAVAIQIE